MAYSAVKSFKQQILKADSFGHPAHLNFMKKGTHYKTLCGAVASIALVSLITYLLAEKCFIMLEYENDTILNYNEIANYEEIGTIELDKLDNVPFYIPEVKRRYILLEDYADF